LKGRPGAPRGADWDRHVAQWRALASAPDARFDREMTVAADMLRPMVTWGTNPSQVIAIDDHIPDPRTAADPLDRAAQERALAYMGLTPGQPIAGLPIDRVF
ncbi:aconitase family protein, partial [Sphingomonas sp. 66-10]